MRKEFFAEGKYLKPLMKKLEKSELSEWLEGIEYMKENNITWLEHENIACLQLYQEDGLYQICIVEII